MSIFSYFTAAHLARFFKVMRQEGWRPAVRRAWYYLRLAARGGGHSALSASPDRGRPAPGPHYLDRVWHDLAQAGDFSADAAPALLMGRRRLALIGDLNLAQCRKYRGRQMAELCAAAGVEFAMAEASDPVRATALMQEATHLMFYRTRADAQMAMYHCEARRLRLPLAYDIDDPLFSVPAYATYGNMAILPAKLAAHLQAQAPGYLAAMAQADIVTVATPGLAEEARRFCPRPVHLRRNFADAETLKAADRALSETVSDRGADAAFRLVFTSGSQGHEADFAGIAEAVERFVTAAPGRELLILGHFDTARLPPGLRERARHRGFAEYPEYLAALARADAALMPLGDDLFNRCKSAVRALDAAAVAVPALVSAVGDLATLVEDGRSGRVLAADAGPQTWFEALEALAADRAATRALGQAARTDLLARWTARAATRPHVTDAGLLDWLRG